MPFNENNEQQCSRWSDCIYMHVYLYLQQFEVCRGFSADYSNFQKDLSCRSSVIWNTFANASFFLPEACSQTFILQCFRHKPVWGLWSTQPTQPESLTCVRNRTLWKLPILLFPSESVFYTFSCHIQKSNAFITIAHCQQCALHYPIYNTAGRVFSRDKECFLANGRQWDCSDFWRQNAFLGFTTTTRKRSNSLKLDSAILTAPYQSRVLIFFGCSDLVDTTPDSFSK